MKYIAGILAAAVVMFGAVAVAQAVDITSDPSGNTYLNGPFEQAAGEIPNYVNPVDGNGLPQRRRRAMTGPTANRSSPPTPSTSEQIPRRSSGAQYLSPGTYHFVCTIHPGMEDDLIVTGGTPEARPSIKVSIPSQKLKKVRKSGTVKVDVKGVKDANGVDLSVNKGNALIGTALDLSVPTGKTSTIPVKLTSSGKKAIKKGNKVTVSVAGSLPFGEPVSAKRTLK